MSVSRKNDGYKRDKEERVYGIIKDKHCWKGNELLIITKLIVLY